MANTLTDILPKLLGRSLPTLRRNCIMPRLVETAYSLVPGKKGKTVDIEIPQAQTATAITAAVTPQANAAVTTDTVQVSLDQWYGSWFELSDQELTQIDKNTQFVPSQMGEAVKALGNNVDTALLNLYKDTYRYTGTAGTTPFASSAADWTTGARPILNSYNAPMSDRSVVLDVDAEANAVNLSAFQDLNASGKEDVIYDGEIGRKLGANWYLNQGIGTHTKGTLAAGTALQLNANTASGDTTFVLKDSGGSLSGTLVVGDILVITGATQPYVVTANATAASNLITASIDPAIDAVYTAGTAVTLIGSHNYNLAFHKGAFALATAPFEPVPDGLGAISSSIVDPLTGLVLRLSVERHWMQTRYVFDILYGVKTLRANQAVRILG